MKVEKVNEQDIDLKKALEEKDKALEILQTENMNQKEQIKAMEDALNERDLAIYNLAIKMSKL